MKKLLILLTLSQLFIFTANAQIEKGRILIGGKLNFNNSNSDQWFGELPNTSGRESKSIEFNFHPQIGYTLGNNWILGTMLIFKAGKTVVNQNSSTSSSSTSDRLTTNDRAFGGALFIRKYFPFGEKFSGFAEFNSGSVWQNQESNYERTDSEATISETKYNELQSNMLAGIAYFPKNWLAVELSSNLLSFTHSQRKNEDDIQNLNSNKFDFGMSTSSINLGVSFFLNNR